MDDSTFLEWRKVTLSIYYPKTIGEIFNNLLSMDIGIAPLCRVHIELLGIGLSLYLDFRDDETLESEVDSIVGEIKDHLA